jgi:ribosomal protein S4E
LDEKKEFKVNDTAVLSLPDRKVKKRIAFGEGVLGVVSHGLHSGYQGKIAKVLPAIASRKSLATIGDIQTLTEYVFAVGDGKPEVTLA